MSDSRERIIQAGNDAVIDATPPLHSRVALAAAAEALRIVKERMNRIQWGEDDEGTEIAICDFCYVSDEVHKPECPHTIVDALLSEIESAPPSGQEPTR